MTRVYECRPYRATIFLTINPGRCPGLSSVGLTALWNSREFVTFVSALADEIAHTAVPHGGISFGTNDLTQTALGGYFEVLATGLRFALLAE